MENLQNSFPEKSPGEIRRIMSRFYKNLTDITLEVIKLERISPEELTDRFKFVGMEHLEKSFERKRSVIVAVGHCGNWEWMGTALGLRSPAKFYALVKPLSDINFNKYMEKLRNRLNPDCTIPFKHAYRYMLRHKEDHLSINVIVADQTPAFDHVQYWQEFLHQETPFFLGVEKLARSLDFDVYYTDISRTGRGRYTCEISLISDDPLNNSPHEIIEGYIRLLETSVSRDPDNWLWSHRRWKFKRQLPGI
jgi:Kdo2-lipid IVA lauroyltransferase/acyltransferase